MRITELHRRLKAQGQSSTVVYVTHDQVEAMTMGDRICVMKDGRIMQVADPETLYARPENIFVAGFIGMPEMNPVKAERDRGHGGAALRIGGQAVHLDPALARRLPANAPRDVTFGIRPQHMRLAGPDDTQALEAQVIKADFLGHEIDVHVLMGDQRMTVVLPVEAFRGAPEDGHIRLHPEGERAHVFDTETGRNLTLA